MLSGCAGAGPGHCCCWAEERSLPVVRPEAAKFAEAAALPFPVWEMQPAVMLRETEVGETEVESKLGLAWKQEEAV